MPVPVIEADEELAETVAELREARIAVDVVLERAWDEAAEGFTRAVKVPINRPRTTLGDPPVIETVAKAGCGP
jgi:DNA-binding response OmpR family regulator